MRRRRRRRRRRRLGLLEQRQWERQGGVLGGGVEREEVVRRLIPCIRARGRNITTSTAAVSATPVRAPPGAGGIGSPIPAPARPACIDIDEDPRTEQKWRAVGIASGRRTLKPHSRALHRCPAASARVGGRSPRSEERVEGDLAGAPLGAALRLPGLSSFSCCCCTGDALYGRRAASIHPLFFSIGSP